MKLEECIKRIEKYLISSDNHPRIVNVNNIEELSKIKEHFCVGDNYFLTVKDYSKEDENPSIDKLFNDLSNKTGRLFIAEFTTFMKIKGEEELNQFIYQLLHSSFSDCKVVVLCYQCEQNLHIPDRRLETFIYLVDGEYTLAPKLLFISNNILIPSGVAIADGINDVASVIESQDAKRIYVNTKKYKKTYSYSLYSIIEETKPFDVLCNQDSITQSLDYKIGSDEQWLYVLKEISKYKSWNKFIVNTFGTCNNLELVASNWKFFDDNKKWMYFIALKLYGARNNWCLDKAVKETTMADKLLRNIYRCLLTEDCKEKGFWKKYNQRKALINSFGNVEKEVLDYCEMVKSKGKSILYYITDNTHREKELIFEALDKYGFKDNYEEIMEVLGHIYPDLYSYLSPYQFKNELLDNYFQTYKYEKVVNKIFPEFEEIVEEQAERRDYNHLLPPRTAKIEAIDKNDSYLYFVDAMGVEFLSFIMEKCRQLDMTANVTVCRCELPSLTRFNKEFVDVFKESGAKLVSGEKGIKELDDLKHEGQEGSNYQTTKLPFHLMRELEIVEEIIKDIHTKLIQGACKKSVMISDHGASRLAVIKDNTLNIDVNSKGMHGGRVCEFTGEVLEIPSATKVETQDGDYYVLANYNRFKGGRAASVETHGGATLEEVVIPIIEIRKAIKDIEISILTPKIKFNIREKNAQIAIFSKTKLSNVTVNINEKFYGAKTDDNQTFTVKMPDLRKAGTYIVKVYSDNNCLKDEKDGLKFIAEKEGFATKSLI